MPHVVPMKTLSGPEFNAWYTKNRTAKGLSDFMSLAKGDRKKALDRLKGDLEAEKPVSAARKKHIVTELARMMSGRDVQKDSSGKYYYPRKQIIQGASNQDIITHLYDRVFELADKAYTRKEKDYANSIVKKFKEASADGKIMEDDVDEMIKSPPV